ncbi:hypothetical protein [Nonomuraea sp. NPDC049625]|uniref:hypothetical protein n=1 Tax=Nonomuraea sp. NPDC049625 TaxID=3155775 RepID=UPI0034299AC5
MGDDEPRFGYGQGRRPPWSERDHDAEQSRDALRAAGLMECSDSRAGEQIAAHAAALRAAGMRAEPGAAGWGRPPR